MFSPSKAQYSVLPPGGCPPWWLIITTSAAFPTTTVAATISAAPGTTVLAATAGRATLPGCLPATAVIICSRTLGRRRPPLLLFASHSGAPTSTIIIVCGLWCGCRCSRWRSSAGWLISWGSSPATTSLPTVFIAFSAAFAASIPIVVIIPVTGVATTHLTTTAAAPVISAVAAPASTTIAVITVTTTVTVAPTIATTVSVTSTITTAPIATVASSPVAAIEAISATTTVTKTVATITSAAVTSAAVTAAPGI
mmetsp:Transcript_115685/g.230609  ORF Transcript_115685/g.230609 Transcript_115685/m.230609 type:complete len:253 (-) Transcript_115685:2579-3337(-)